MLQTGGSGLMLLEEVPATGGGSEGSIERESLLIVVWGADVSGLVLSLSLESSWEVAAAAAVDDSATVADSADCDLNSAGVSVFIVDNWGSVDSVGAVFWLDVSG